MGRNKKMDKLSQDSCDALEAGMSYGKYMAMKGPTKVTPPEPTEPNRICQQSEPTEPNRICQQCGKSFYVPDNRKKKFCSDRCRELSYYEPKIKTFKRICPICNKEFVTTKAQQKYCGDFCARVAKTQMIREWKEKTKEEIADG